MVASTLCAWMSSHNVTVQVGVTAHSDAACREHKMVQHANAMKCNITQCCSMVMHLAYGNNMC
jgi:hypothetical protein